MTRLLLMTSQVAGLGDVILASPVLKALREAHPDARIALFTSRAAEEAGRAYASLYDDLLLYRGVRDFLRNRGRFDRVICLSEALSSVLLARLAGGAGTYGFDWHGRGIGLTVSVPYRKPERKHILDQYAEVARLAGIRDVMPKTWFPIAPGARASATAWLQAGAVALHPGAGEPAKRWPFPRYAELALRLARDRGVPVLLLGGPAEEPLRRELPAHPLIRDAIGRLTLQETAACLAGARLFVGNDGGILHLAAALDRPMVALYRSLNFTKAAPRHAGARVLLARRDGAPSPDIADISLDEAWAALLQCLGETG